MEQNIVIAGATFNGVPSIEVPVSGGGSASFVEVSDTTATAADVASGKYFYTAAGVKTVGIASGAVVQPLSVTQNGTYNPPSGVDGYAPVTVNVSGGGGDDPFALTNYIESNGTQWIDTGYFIQANTKIEVVCNIKNVSSYVSIFGNDSGSSNGRFGLDRSYSGSSFIDIHGNTYTSFTSGTAFLNVKIAVRKYYGTGIRLETNDILCASTTYSVSYASNNSSLCIFVRKVNGTANSFASMKLYRFRIYEGDNLVHEFIPWQENGVACLKDTVTAEIKYNAGTGDFVYGTDA